MNKDEDLLTQLERLRRDAERLQAVVTVVLDEFVKRTETVRRDIEQRR